MRKQKTRTIFILLFAKTKTVPLVPCCIHLVLPLTPSSKQGLPMKGHSLNKLRIHEPTRLILLQRNTEHYRNVSYLQESPPFCPDTYVRTAWGINMNTNYQTVLSPHSSGQSCTYPVVRAEDCSVPPDGDTVESSMHQCPKLELFDFFNLTQADASTIAPVFHSLFHPISGNACQQTA